MVKNDDFVLYEKPNITDKENNIDFISNIFITNENIDYLNQKPKKKTNYNIKKLLNNYSLTQSQQIYFGIQFEKNIKKILKQLGYKTLYDENLVQLFNNDKKEVKNKGKKDIDLCFIINNVIYYFEVKTNLYLDTEKAYVSDKKMRLLKDYILDEYPNYELVVGCLTAWYNYEKEMTIRPHYKIYFMNEFFNIIRLNNITKQEYECMLHRIGQKIVSFIS